MISVPEKEMLCWIDALRSGKYVQRRGMLLDSDHAQCCLGVACTLAGIADIDILTRAFPDHSLEVPNWIRMINEDFNRITGEFLTDINDREDSFSFDEISDLLQAVYIEKVLS